MEISRKAWGDAAYHNVFHLASSPIKTKLSIDEFRVIIDELFGYNKPTSLNHTSFTLVAEKHKAKFPEFLKRLNVKADNTRTSQGKVGKSAQTTEVAGKIEGAKYDIISTRYERNSKNRAACLKIHGYACKICGFEFVKKYGQYGKGYIQVHHVEPLSEIGNEVVVDPKVDLIPICCNCHAMIHHKTPALTPKELKRIYAKRMV
ncbi:MAG: HNH endonuclease [Fibrobacteres bacterium]|nr:HNH endonuclease [Fibrobacterota bacterium]